VKRFRKQDLVISKLLRQDIEKYKSLFAHVSAAIQLSSNAEVGKRPSKGDTIQYVYINSKHNDPLCRVVPLEILQKCKENIDSKENTFVNYDKEKYKEMILDAAETVLCYFGFNKSLYGMSMRNRKRKWYEELHEERTKDIQTEML